MADNVVIVGLACRYPEAEDPEQLWRNIMSRRRSFRPLPPQRLPLADYGGPGADQTYATRAALLDGWHFDRQRYRVPGEVFRAVDLSHWLALDASAAALADAGLPDGDGVDRGRVGVVLGNSLTGEFSRAATLRTRWPYVRRAVAAALTDSAVPREEWGALLGAVERRFKAPFPEPSDETLAGALANTIAGRICNHFDFHGTGYIVDGACASSLLAVSVAATAVASGQLEVALAGGVDLSLDPFELVGFARLGALAQGDMRVYDRRPTGFLPGEGCGVVVLCRESYAHRRGLRPYARLLGWGTSSDGNGGLTRPELVGQRLALRRAYEQARLAPDRVALVEGHGTGTEVGDLTELRTLLDVRGPAAARAALGSIKANIGHTKAAAGVAGLIKAALAVHREVLPPTTGCAEPHPLLADPASTLEALDEARPWPTAERYASVSAMGFGGINAHAVLGGVAPTGLRRLGRQQRHLAARHPGREVVVCAADGPERLAAKLIRVRDAARQLSRGELTDLAATLAATERGGAPARFAAAVSSAEELVAAAEHALERLAAGDRQVLDRARRLFVVVGRPLRVGLLFSGQAAPCYPGAGALADLLDELPPGFDDRLPVAAARPPGAPGERTERHSPGPVDTAAAQPAIVRSTLAGLRWLEVLGVRAHEALGHSLGELGALVWAGALDESDVYTLAKARGAAMAAAGEPDPARDAGPGGGEPVRAERGGMASLRADAETVAGLVEGGGAVLAADNGPMRTVVSGRRADVQHVVDAAARLGIDAVWLPVSHAFHSPLMAPAAGRVRAAAERVGWHPPSRPVASTVTGGWLAGEDPVELLVRQLTAPVRFREALALLRADLLVEVGPGQILADLAGPDAVPMDAGSSSADGVATATAALFAAGAFDSAEPYFARRYTRRFDLDRPREFLVNPCEAALPPGRVADVPVPLPAAEPADAHNGPLTAAGPSTMASARAGGSQPDPVAAAMARVAAAVELDPGAIPGDTRLLADLHLSSLRVGQLAAEVAADLGRAMPTAPLALATATVEELAAAVAALPPADAEEPPAAGVAGWVRVFGPQLVPRPAPGGPAVQRDWEIVGDLAGHPLAAAIRSAFPATGGEPARLLAMPPGLRDVPVGGVVAALRASHADGRPLVVVHHAGIGAAVGRSLAVERADVPVLVLEVPPDAAGIAAAAAEAHRALRPYAEVVYGDGGVRTEPAIRPLEISPRRDGGIPLGPDDTCVVTGGAKGIGLECAVALAAATGVRTVLLGRSPATDGEVRAALARVAATGVPTGYKSVDVTDTAAVAGALAEVRERFGPVRALLHAAGQNRPALIGDLTEGGLRGALAPKADGLDHVIAALDPTELRVAVTFGSVIGRTGLAGETDYAIANEWLARRCAELTAAAPDVRWLNIEWSAWSETGMGVRLGVLDGLIRQGLRPVPVDEGVDILLRLLATPTLPPSVLVAGRLPTLPTLRWSEEGDESDGAGGRFLESRRAGTPRVELVADASLSLGTDPYLADHRIDGAVVLPAVLGLEAMAQACVALGAKPARAGFTGVSLTRPVTVPERGHRVLRTAALAGENGDIDVVVRSEETGLAVDHFRATYADRPGGASPAGPALAGDLLPAGELYGPLFFHGERFRRVLGYHGLSAYRCAGAIAADPDARWFGAFHDQRLVLGDPGARDAFLHMLQGCLPDRRLLPVAAEQVRMYARPEGRLTLVARQRAEDGDSYVFDLTVCDAGGSVVEQWQGLTLRAVGPLDAPRRPIGLVGAHLTRVLRRWRPASTVDLAVARAGRTDHERSRAVAAWLAGSPVSRAADGRLLVSGAGSVSASHLDGHVLVAAGQGRVAVDWELADGPASPPLGGADAALAAELGRAGPFRVWTCREVVRKLGLPPAEPLVLDGGPDGARPAGWAALSAGGYTLYSAVVDTTSGPVAACVGEG